MKTTFKDFLNEKNFTIYEVFDDGTIRQFNKAELSTPDGGNAAVRVSLGFSVVPSRYIDVYLHNSVGYGKISTIFIDREAAKAFAVKRISLIIEKASKNLSNVVNNKIDINDVFELDSLSH